MLGVVVGTVAFIVAAWLIKRRFDEMDYIPKGMTRNATIFALALAASYVAAMAADWIARK